MIHADPQDVQAARLLRRSLGADAEHCVFETMQRAFADGEVAAGRRWSTVWVLLGAPGLDEVPLAHCSSDDADHEAACLIANMYAVRRVLSDA
jgi:hypothetical protein